MVLHKLYSPDATQRHDDEDVEEDDPRRLALCRPGQSKNEQLGNRQRYQATRDVCTSHADYISCDVTSSEVDHVTSLHIGVVSPTSDEIGDVASTLLGLIPWKVFIVATVLARKFHKNLRNFRWKDAWLYVYVFRLKNHFLGLKPWPDAFLPGQNDRQLTLHTLMHFVGMSNLVLRPIIVFNNPERT